MRSRAVLLVVALGAVAAAHFALGVASHEEHVLHVALQLGFLLVIVAAAIWFGLRGGLVAGAGAAALLGVHAAWSWRGQPMENVNQLAMMVVYVAVGGVSGALVRAEARQRARRAEQERRATREKVVEALAALESALGFRHEATRGHGERVAALAVRIGEALVLDGEALERLRLAGLVHDLGKLGVADDVLLKPGQLSAQDRLHVERHPAAAAEILRHVRGAEEIAGIVVAHHERLDGSGYPRGLREGEIAPEALVLAVADVYCALAEPRSYKGALSTPEILAIMAPLAGAQLDARAFAALRTVLAGTPEARKTKAAAAPVSREMLRPSDGRGDRI